LDVQEIGLDGAKWSYLAQDRGKLVYLSCRLY